MLTLLERKRGRDHRATTFFLQKGRALAELAVKNSSLPTDFLMACSDFHKTCMDLQLTCTKNLQAFKEISGNSDGTNGIQSNPLTLFTEIFSN